MVRLYESTGRAGAGHLGPGFPVVRAEVTDLLERRLHESDLAFGLRPFQILTRSLRPK
ncbi:glycosyl hydrolase-related protein [Streptomyces mirabilis]|uniref:glycosyl hydrolase-related protein n=1 Tax=Streptomyces mirabilis TaxID=68239 RepID=UPI0036DA8A12